MTNDELSELEIKLLNSTLKFSKDKMFGTEIKRYSNGLTDIKMKKYQHGMSLIWFDYSNLNNPDKKILINYSKGYEKEQREFYESLINEIPEIKDRIELY